MPNPLAAPKTLRYLPLINPSPAVMVALVTEPKVAEGVPAHEPPGQRFVNGPVALPCTWEIGHTFAGNVTPLVADAVGNVGITSRTPVNRLKLTPSTCPPLTELTTPSSTTIVSAVSF